MSDSSLNTLAVSTVPLNNMRSGQSGVIHKVNSSELLEKQCEALGLSPGNQIRVLRQPWGKGLMQVKSQGSYFAIRAEEAANIQVHVLGEQDLK